MPRFSSLSAADVRKALTLNCSKIKTQTSSCGLHKEVVKSFNFCLVDDSEPFQIEDFISVLRPTNTKSVSY